MSILLTFPVPNSALNPNSRVHWAKKAAFAAMARASAYAVGVTARLAGAFGPPFPSASVRPRFTFKRGARRDRDNLMARCKPVWDGLTDAGLWVDDSLVTFEPVEIDVDPETPHDTLTVLVRGDHA